MTVYTNGTDTVAAESIEDVPAAWESSVGVSFIDEGNSLDEWRIVPSDKPITINDYDGHGGHGGKLTLTAAEWAARDGRGLLCSTEY